MAEDPALFAAEHFEWTTTKLRALSSEGEVLWTTMRSRKGPQCAAVAVAETIIDNIAARYAS